MRHVSLLLVRHASLLPKVRGHASGGQRGSKLIRPENEEKIASKTSKRGINIVEDVKH